jgi:hypothetical protein
VTISRPYPRSPLDYVLALSSTDVWFAEGGRIPNLLIEHWNGRRISVSMIRSARSPEVNEGLEGFGGTRANVWLLAGVGPDYSASYLEHWNGFKWARAGQPFSTTVLGTNQWYAVASSSSRDLWVAGGGLVGHWDGSHWHSINTRLTNSGHEVWNVLDLGPRDVWAVGDTAIGHFEGTRWRLTPAPAHEIAGGVVSAIAGYKRGPLYTLGFLPGPRGFVLHWKRGRWVRVSVPLPKGSWRFFSSVAVSLEGEAWAAGETWKTLPSGSPGQAKLLIEHYVPCA